MFACVPSILRTALRNNRAFDEMETTAVCRRFRKARTPSIASVSR